MDIEPLKFWMERKDSPLYNLALQLHSVPCSSASVEWLFSKAGIVLSQWQTHLQSSQIEQLLFLEMKVELSTKSSISYYLIDQTNEIL